MRSDFLSLTALCAANPAIAEGLQLASVPVGALANCSVVDKSIAGMQDSYLDLINKLALYEQNTPFTVSPYRPVSGLPWPVEMAVGPTDIVIPIRFTLPSTGTKVTPLPIASLDPTIRFSNNTVSGAIDVDVFCLSFNGYVMSNYTRNTVIIPTGGANSSAEATILSGQRAVQVITNSANVSTLATPQSSAFFDMIEILPVAINTPSLIDPVLDYGTVPGASVTGFARPYTVALVFRQLGIVSADVTVTPCFAGPTGSKDLINKLLTLIHQSM